MYGQIGRGWKRPRSSGLPLGEVDRLAYRTLANQRLLIVLALDEAHSACMYKRGTSEGCW